MNEDEKLETPDSSPEDEPIVPSTDPDTEDPIDTPTNDPDEPIEEPELPINRSIYMHVRTMIGPQVDDFKIDIITYINTALFSLYQLGVTKKPFHIVDEKATWSDFLGDNETSLEIVKSYIVKKVKMMFDPVTNSAVLQAEQRLLDQLAWQINSEIDYSVEEEPESVEDSEVEDYDDELTK